MLAFRNNSDALIVVLHEIYGINEHIKGVCKSLSDLGYDVVCPDLLDGKAPYAYDREEEAHWYFMNYEGFESSVKRITFLLRQEEMAYRQIFLLGYSVGATIAWLYSGEPSKYGAGYQYHGHIENLNGVIGYYGSRIRDYLEVSPKCSVLLFFPEEETSFDPQELQEELIKKDYVEVHILPGKHGFADPDSAKYNEGSAKEAERIRKNFFERTRT